MIDNFNNYVTRWVTTQERFSNKSMLMTGINNKLRFRNIKLYLMIRQIQDVKKLYSDKKEVSYAKSQSSEPKQNLKAKLKFYLGKFYRYL